jgi:hypothetical protein
MASRVNTRRRPGVLINNLLMNSYSAIAFKELRPCKAILDKEHLFILTSINNPIYKFSIVIEKFF